LHPTAAVCGLPKEAAKAFILENEEYDREYYSGFLGELNIDFATFRTQQPEVTEQEEEAWQELENKFNKTEGKK
jgi:hypothetical protein